MPTSRKHQLVEAAWPEFGTGERPPAASLEEFQSRIDAARLALKSRQLTHLVVYGDREHFANLAYLTGFDPRFEEALLVIRAGETPVLIVGNECEAYLSVSPLFAAGRLRSERFQPFSLLNQPRASSRMLDQIFRDLGITKGSSVGCVGWKYFSAAEHPLGNRAIDLPAYITDTLRELAGRRKRGQCDGHSHASGSRSAHLLLAGGNRLFRVHQRTGVRRNATDHFRFARRDERPRGGAACRLQRRTSGLSHDVRHGSKTVTADWPAPQAPDPPQRLYQHERLLLGKQQLPGRLGGFLGRRISRRWRRITSRNLREFISRP